MSAHFRSGVGGLSPVGYYDRFIPQHRNAQQEALSSYLMATATGGPSEKSDEIEAKKVDPRSAYACALQILLLGQLLDGPAKSRILTFKPKPPEDPKLLRKRTRMEPLDSFRSELNVQMPRSARVSRVSDRLYHGRILDAPGVVNTFYANLLDTSSNGLLVVALGTNVYTRCSESKKITKVPTDDLELDPNSAADYVSCVKFTPDGNLFVGGTSGRIAVYDQNLNRIETFRPDQDGDYLLSVGSLPNGAFVLTTSGGHVITTKERFLELIAGGRADEAFLFDKQDQHGGLVATVATQAETPGFPTSSRFVTTGDDGIVKFWSRKKVGGEWELSPKGEVIASREGGVKALAWHPTQDDIVVTGGGRNDPVVRVWEYSSQPTGSRCLVSTRVKGQVTSLTWSEDGRELAVATGYPQSRLKIYRVVFGGFDKRSIRLMKTANLKKLSQERVLTMKPTSNGGLVTLDTRETLYFFPNALRVAPPKKTLSSLMNQHSMMR